MSWVQKTKANNGAATAALSAHDSTGAANFTLQLANLEQVKLAYGEDIAQQSLDFLLDWLKKYFSIHARIFAVAGDLIEIRVRRVESAEGCEIAAKCRKLLGELCQSIPSVEIATAFGPIHFWLQGGWQSGDETGVLTLQYVGNPPGKGKVWAKRYRSAMALSHEALVAVGPARTARGVGGRSLLWWRPVVNACPHNVVLYDDVGFRNRRGLPLSSSDTTQALERLGFARLVDHRLLSVVLDELESKSGHALGVAISGRSLTNDYWWDAIRARLRASPEVARRLIVEIAETAPIPDPSAAARLLAGLQRLGCRVVLSHFGTGVEAAQRLKLFAPDFVKIDRFFLHDCATRPGLETFYRVLELAASQRGVVIVDGVETHTHAEFVRMAGCVWQQGSYWSRRASSQQEVLGARVGGGFTFLLRKVTKEVTSQSHLVPAWWRT